MDILKSQLSMSHMKMIHTIAHSETVKEAADRLYISQPALTNRIREAERRLNTLLFVRHGRKLIMTSAGFRLLHSATKILDELARAELDIAQLSDGIEQVIRFGLPHYASFKWLPNVITYFQEKLPEISIEVSGDATKQPLDSLFRGDVDIIFISTASKQLTLNHTGYQSQFIVEDELLACLSKQNDNANKAFLTAEDFTKQTYITNSTIPEKDREYELLFKPAHQIPRQVLQVGFNDAIIELIKANIGISILSKRLLNAYLPTNEIVTKPIGKNGLNVYWHLIYSNQPEIALPAEVLANQLKLFVQSN